MTSDSSYFLDGDNLDIDTVYNIWALDPDNIDRGNIMYSRSYNHSTDEWAFEYTGPPYVFYHPHTNHPIYPQMSQKGVMYITCNYCYKSGKKSKDNCFGWRKITRDALHSLDSFEAFANNCILNKKINTPINNKRKREDTRFVREEKRLKNENTHAVDWHNFKVLTENINDIYDVVGKIYNKVDDMSDTLKCLFESYA